MKLSLGWSILDTSPLERNISIGGAWEDWDASRAANTPARTPARTSRENLRENPRANTVIHGEPPREPRANLRSRRPDRDK